MAAAASMPAPQLGAPAMQPAYAQSPMQAPYNQERTPPIGNAAMPSAYAPAGDSSMARRAAIALGITLPFIGLPVGWIFMMIEDRNKQAVGRLCATWSLLGLVAHLVLTWFMFQQAIPILMRVLTVAAGAMGPKGGGEAPPSIP